MRLFLYLFRQLLLGASTALVAAQALALAIAWVQIGRDLPEVSPLDHPRLVAAFVGLQLPYTVPLALAAGALFTYARLGAEGELLAARAGGVSPLGLAAPALAAGALLSLALGASMVRVVPAAWRAKYVEIERAASEGLSLVSALARARTGGPTLSVDAESADGETLRGLFAYVEGDEEPALLVAGSARARAGKVRGDVTLDLERGALVRVHRHPPGTGSPVTFERGTVRLPLSRALAGDRAPRKLRDIPLDDLARDPRPVARAMLLGQVGLALSALGLALAGMAVGLAFPGRLAPLGAALVLTPIAVLYYALHRALEVGAALHLVPASSIPIALLALLVPAWLVARAALGGRGPAGAEAR